MTEEVIKKPHCFGIINPKINSVLSNWQVKMCDLADIANMSRDCVHNILQEHCTWKGFRMMGATAAKVQSEMNSDRKKCFSITTMYPLFIQLQSENNEFNFKLLLTYCT